MKLFKSREQYELVTLSEWGDQTSNEEIIITGTKHEIDDYAKTANFTWRVDKSNLFGGYFVKTIDGYRETKFELRKKS